MATRSALQDSRGLPAGLLALAAGSAIAFMVNPVLGMAIGAATLLAGMEMRSRDQVSRLFLVGLGVILTGYALFSRSFGHVGIPPIYVGELVLFVGILAWALNPRRWVAFGSPVALMIVAFAIWGALRTLPYLSVHGLDALRDGVLWGYAAFALLIVPLLLRKGRLERVPEWYAWAMPFFLAWAPLGLLLKYSIGDGLPTVPGADRVGLLELKGGDVGTHLGGVMAFLLVGLAGWSDGRGRRRRGLVARIPIWVLWTLWGIGFVAAASVNRGGMLAAFASIGVILALRFPGTSRRVVTMGAVVLSAILTLAVLDVSYDRGPNVRNISARQLVLNTVSIVGEGPRDEGIAATREWRLNWWSDIVGYTIHGEYFWTGKGFGVDLSLDDGINRKIDGNRHPHNGHMNVLARAGVPGLVLWACFLAGFVVSMLRSFGAARARGDHWRASFHAWILAYWTAFAVNISFDTFLEGPQGGIWFWCLTGTGIALVMAGRGAGRRRNGTWSAGGGRMLEPSRPRARNRAP